MLSIYSLFLSVPGNVTYIGFGLKPIFVYDLAIAKNIGVVKIDQKEVTRFELSQSWACTI